MRPKPLFADRPHLDRVVRAIALLGFLALFAVAVATADIRIGALAVGLAAFALRETFELDETRDRAALLVFWGCVMTWVVFTFV